MSEIVIDKVTKIFGESGGKPFTAIDGVNLNVADREFISVVGPSGCGKTTLMRMVAGLESISRGEIRVAGKAVTGPGPDRAVVFQQFALFPWKTVRENIVFGMRSRGASQEGARRGGRVLSPAHEDGGHGRQVPPSALGRHAAARGHRPKLRDRSGRAPDGRALRRAWTRRRARSCRKSWCACPRAIRAP